MTNISLGSATDQGKREFNEDSVLAVVAHAPSIAAMPESGTSALLILADGMGGRAKGKLASRTAVKTVYRELAHILAMPVVAERGYLENALQNALRQANSKIKDIGEGSPESDGMGTTCTVCVITSGFLALAHVGDSRAYLARPDQEIEALTEDHSVVAGEIRAGRLTEDEARKSKFRNVITRAVGVDEDVVADIQTFSLIPGELSQVVITSDGLHGVVLPERIDEIVRTSRTPQDAADQLVAEAKANKAKDNISVIVAKIEPGADAPAETTQAQLRSNAKLPGNILAFLLGILITGVMAWVALPGLLSPKTLLAPMAAPVIPKPVAIGDLKSSTYAAPESLIGREVLGSVLLRSGDNMVVVDPAGPNVLQVEPDGKVLTSVLDKAKLSAIPERDLYWAADAQGDLYESMPGNGFIRKYDPEGRFLRTVGEKVLTKPEAITVAENGDIYVVDQNILKRLKAISPPPSATTPPTSKPAAGSAPTTNSGT